jgi:hypothetical protein
MIPPSFKPATLRGMLPVCPDSDDLGVSFDLADGSIVRLRIPMADVRGLYRNIYDRRGVQAFHPDSSSGNPSVDGSVTPGQSV